MAPPETIRPRLTARISGGDGIGATSARFATLSENGPVSDDVDPARPSRRRAQAGPGTTWCELKGAASYFDVVCPSGRVVPRAAWHFPQPTTGYEALVGQVAFYAGLMDRCTGR